MQVKKVVDKKKLNRSGVKLCMGTRNLVSYYTKYWVGEFQAFQFTAKWAKFPERFNIKLRKK